MSKKTLVLGASEKPHRFSYKAVRALEQAGYEVVAIGRREGKIGEIPIQTGIIPFEDIHTVTLYLNPENQKDYYHYIFSLRPQRIIFNPGTENLELEAMATGLGIKILEQCTLVMLDEGLF